MAVDAGKIIIPVKLHYHRGDAPSGINYTRLV